MEVFIIKDLRNDTIVIESSNEYYTLGCLRAIKDMELENSFTCYIQTSIKNNLLKYSVNKLYIYLEITTKLKETFNNEFDEMLEEVKEYENS